MATAKVRTRERVLDLDEEGEELVECFVSGERVPRSEAVQVRIGPRHRVWMLPEYTRDWEPNPRE